MRTSSKKRVLCWAACTLLGATLLTVRPVIAQTHVINVLADRDSRYKMPGQSRPQIVVKAGEPILLHIEARRGTTWDRDGTVHGFTLLRAKDRAKVPGWNLELMAGVQEFSLRAPAEPGEYEVVCTVICSDEHEGMRMKFLVVP